MKYSLFLIALTLLVTACSDRLTTSTEMVFDQEESTPGEEVTFTFVQQNIFNVSCALNGCHADAEFPNLSAARAYASIVDVPSSQGLKLVAPGEPESSYLFIKIADSPGMAGSRMPRGSAPLPEASIAAVRNWIERGAPDD